MPCRIALACLLSAAVLAGCASPSVEFAGAPDQRVTIEGTRFAVFRRGDAAQAIRLDHASRAEQPRMPARLRAAIEVATGCTIVAGSDGPTLGLQNDSAVLTARIAC